MVSDLEHAALSAPTTATESGLVETVLARAAVVATLTPQHTVGLEHAALLASTIATKSGLVNTVLADAAIVLNLPLRRFAGMELEHQ